MQPDLFALGDGQIVSLDHIFAVGKPFWDNGRRGPNYAFRIDSTGGHHIWVGQDTPSFFHGERLSDEEMKRKEQEIYARVAQWREDLVRAWAKRKVS